MKTKYTQKKTLTTLLLVCLVLVLSAAKCQKDNDPPEEEDKLPPATQTGENTFGCKINGKIWESRLPLPHSLSGPSRLTGGPGMDGSFWVRARRKVSGDPEEFVELLIKENVFDEGEYLIGSPEGGGYSLNEGEGGILCRWDTKQYSESGKLVITRYDMEEGIFSGEFYFTVKIDHGDCEEIVEITEGRFDIGKK